MSTSSSSYASTVELRLRPSMRALRWVFFVHLLCIALLPFALQAKTPLMILLVGLAASWFWLRRHPALGFGPRALTRMVWHADGSWSAYRGEREFKVELLANSLVHSRLLVLNFRSDQGVKLNRVIAGDEVEAEPLRRLRARLKLA